MPLGSYRGMVEGVGTIGSLEMLLARYTRRWLPPSLFLFMSFLATRRTEYKQPPKHQEPQLEHKIQAGTRSRGASRQGWGR